MSFDPYHQWLGIPPEQQPPDSYQLLGVRRFESNPIVISNAAERQLLMLKSLQNGPHASLTQKLMTEVTAARIRLLDSDKKARYDAELKNRNSSDRSAPPPLTTEPVDRVQIGPPTRQESVSVPPPTQKQPAETVIKPEVSNRRSVSGRSKMGPRVPIITAAAVAAASMTLIAVWISQVGDSTRQTNRQFRNGPRASTKQQLSPQQRRTSRPQPPVPPWVKLQRENLRKKPSPNSEREAIPPQILMGNGSQDNTLLERYSIDIPPTDDDVANDTNDSAEPTDMSRDSEADDSVADGTAKDTRATDVSGETSTSEIPVFSLLPSHLNLLGTVATTGTDYVFVGKLASPSKDSWKITLEDYGAPNGQSRFLVGERATDDDGLHWPLFRSAYGRTPTDERSDTVVTSPSDVLARVDANATELSLWLADPKNRSLIDHLSRCGLVIENAEQKHHVQLALPRRIPPIALSLDKTRERITLDGGLGADDLFRSRLCLELLYIAHGIEQVAVASGLQADFDEELTVSLDAGLQCELGITLTESEDQLALSVMPRYIHNDRQEAMAPSKLTRELLRSKAQLNRNRRDLAEAQNALRVLPGQVNRVRSMPVRTPSDASARQSSLSQLVSMHDSAQSRARRLTNVIPDLTARIQRMEEVLEFSKDLPDEVKLHFRIFARGQTGNFLLLVAADSDHDSAAIGDVEPDSFGE